MEETEDMLDIERPEDPAAFEPLADLATDGVVDNNAETITLETTLNDHPSCRIDRVVLRNIELEVMELRASLEPQGLHRDAIDDICDEKRQRLIEEHEASLASPARNQSENGEKDDDSSMDQEKNAEVDEAEQEPLEEKRKGTDIERQREVDKGKEKEREKEKEKIREDRAKEKEREKEKDDRMKDKE